ncbi:galactose oxidase [Backusella circina FSU 941]|nr:galactose oxidase [Backusella circina FSU 941]
MSSGTQSIADLTTETKQTTGDVPPPLVGASTVIAANKLYVFGGRLVSSRQMTNHLYILNLDTLVWTHHVPEPDSSPPPRARYFHSSNLYGGYIVIFGGMSHSVRRSSQSLCALDDVCLFDLERMVWKYPEIQPSIFSPQARYAHLAVCASDKLIVMGGQDMSNQYINEINVFDLSSSSWTHGGQLNRQYGAYRAVAFCPTDIDTALMSSQPFWERATNAKGQQQDIPLCVYSNYNFTDVTRDLQMFSPLSSTEFKDFSAEMTGSALPPGLRFPSGDLLGHHMILTGTYLTPSHRSFHIWALNLANLVWVRIDTGSVLAQGSWNRGVLYEDKQQFFVFGDKNRDLLEDYNHRQVNFAHVAVVDLEAFGIYSYPKETCAPVAQELGLSMLNEPSMSDIEIVTSDGRSIPANSSVIRQRWAHFEHLLQEKRGSGHKQLLFPENYPVTLAFLQFIYSDHLMTAQQHHPQILSRLLILADMHAIPRLGLLATHALHQILTISTASMVYETAALTGRTALQIRALRVMINAKKMLQQQQLQNSLGAGESQIFGDPASSPLPPPGSHFNISPHRSHEDFDPHNRVSPSNSTPRRMTGSKSSTTAAAMEYTPSPKLSKSSTLYHQGNKPPPHFADRPRKPSLVPSMYSEHTIPIKNNGYMTPSFDRPNIGNRF